MQLSIVSFNGDTRINDLVNFQSGFPRGTLFRLVRARGVGGERIGDFPLWALKDLKGGTLTIETTPLGTLHKRRDVLAQIFDVYDTSGPKRLIVEDQDNQCGYMLVNGDMENWTAPFVDNEPDGWTDYELNPGNLTAEANNRESTEVYHGTYSLETIVTGSAGAGGDKGVYQDILARLTVGVTYTLVVYVQNAAITAGTVVVMASGDNSGNAVALNSGAANATYTRYTVNFTPNALDTFLRIYAYLSFPGAGGSGTVYFDKMMVYKADGLKQWYCDVDPVDFKPSGGSPASYIITLFAPDPQWRELTELTSTWAITGTGEQHVLQACGNRPTPLELRITPTANKGNDFNFEHLVDVRNPNQWELNQYPVDLTNGGWDTATIITATEMLGLGQDLRTFVDGKEVDRWIADINTADTKVWINLDMRPGAQAQIGVAFAPGAATLTYLKGTLRGRFKRRNGCFRIDNEMVAYAVWNKKTHQFTGCTRGIRGTADVNHAALSWVFWVEHHIQIKYGDATLTAPAQNDEYQPAFNISTSTNAEWRHDSFGDEQRKRSGRWMHKAAGELERNQAVDYYTGNQGAMADPWTEMGLKIIKRNPTRPGDYWDHWYWRGQVAITNTRFEGEHQEDNAADIVRMILRDKVPETKWRLMWQENLSGSVGAFAAWPSSPITQAPRAGTTHLRLQIKRITEGDAIGDCYTEVNATRLTFSATEIPDVDGPTTWARIVNPYILLARIDNITTGEYIEFDFGMALNQMLRTRSEYHDITYRGEGQYQALVEASSWEDWLMLQPGANTLQITEVGVAGTTIVFYWRGRNS